MYSRVHAYFEEFPFLKNYFVETDIPAVKVQRIDQNLLHKAGIGNIYLFNGGGQLVTRVGGSVTCFSDLFSCLFGDSGEETVDHALRRLGNKASDVHFVICHDWGHLTIYKPPKGYPLIEWTQREIADERGQIRRQVEEIDGEATA